MADPKWRVDGEYFENCNCDFVCPCITSNMTASPTQGDCKVALVFKIDKGKFDAVDLGGLAFVVAARAPGPMMDGNWTVGLIVDDSASQEQQDAIVAIASGSAGGPMAALGGLIGNFAGVERKPIQIKTSAMTKSVSIPGVVEMETQGVAAADDPDTPIVIDNGAHPVNRRLALARSARSHLHAFGIDWDDDSGTNNGHFAPFSWQSA